jgi:hypothetical protein
MPDPAGADERQVLDVAATTAGSGYEAARSTSPVPTNQSDHAV